MSFADKDSKELLFAETSGEPIEHEMKSETLKKLTPEIISAIESIPMPEEFLYSVGAHGDEELIVTRIFHSMLMEHYVNDITLDASDGMPEIIEQVANAATIAYTAGQNHLRYWATFTPVSDSGVRADA